MSIWALVIMPLVDGCVWALTGKPLGIWILRWWTKEDL